MNDDDFDSMKHEYEGSPNKGSPDEGAPIWMVTFGDLMSLLLCFFVLLLSFSEMDRQKFRRIAGSMEKAFGIQRKKNILDVPKGEKIIGRYFDQDVITLKIKEEIVKEIRQEVIERFSGVKDLIQVDVVNNEVVIRLMGETTFDSGKAEIKRQMIPLLQKIGLLIEDTEGEIIVSGHTDNVPIRGGPYRNNLVLSMARAASVAEFLLYRTSIEPQRIATMGFGEYRPMESNDTPEGRKKNRRVEIVLSDIPLVNQPY